MSLAHGREGFTEKAWRRRGLARLLMEEVLKGAKTSRIDTLVLHASGDGRPLYEQLGFAQTNEMRYQGVLRPACRRLGLPLPPLVAPDAELEKEPGHDENKRADNLGHPAAETAHCDDSESRASSIIPTAMKHKPRAARTTGRTPG